MWKVVLGVAVLLQAGATRADEKQSTAHVDCTTEPAGADCKPGEADVQEAPEPSGPPEVPPVAPAPPAAVATPAAVAAVAPTPAGFATVSFRNDVGKKLRLVEAQFTLDGAKLPVILTGAEPGKSYTVVSRPVLPGPHVVTARLTYQGDRRVFSYMKGYKLNVRSDQVLTAPENRPVSFTVVSVENVGMNVPLERRVTVKVEEGGR